MPCNIFVLCIEPKHYLTDSFHFQWNQRKTDLYLNHECHFFSDTGIPDIEIEDNGTPHDSTAMQGTVTTSFSL